MGVFPKINPTTIPPIEAPTTPIIIKGMYPLIDFIKSFSYQQSIQNQLLKLE